MSPAWHVRGLVLPDEVERDVYVDGDRISFEPVDGAVTLARDVYLLPGLVDVHAHLALHSPAGDDAPTADRVRASALAHLDAGVLTVREPGGPDHSSIGLGPADGLPRIITAGRFLAPPGRYFPGLAREVPSEELPTAALEELAASGAWVKVIADSPLPGPGMTATYSAEDLAETVRVVHAAGGRVAVHCALPEVIDAAIAAGVDSLEHASLLRPDQVEALAASHAAWVPTCSINAGIRHLVTPAEGALLDRQAESLQAAVDAGVPILAGTDAGMVPHGGVRDEIRLLTESGVPLPIALAGGSWQARTWLGLPGIEPGAPADLVAYRDDPREDLHALATPAVLLLSGRPITGATTAT